MSSDPAIFVRDLGKAYSIAGTAARHNTLAESLLHRLRNPLERGGRTTFWAVRDVDFDIHQGEVVGIVGRNGAGKSTLLKLLSRITPPTTGRIDLWGRVGSLLEVGTGFHPELTGRENIFMNGAILGMARREILRQFDAIVDFAEVAPFLDTPVKRYSSGMYVRLAFAVAAHLNPEILIVDEVLAVGDAAFQRKCLGKMKDVAHGEGRTVLFVSHNMAAIRSLCDRALLMEKGMLRLDDTPDAVVARYAAEIDASPNAVRWRPEDSPSPDFCFVGARAVPTAASADADVRPVLACAEPMAVEVTYEIRGAVPLRGVRIGFSVQTPDGVLVCRSNDPHWAESLPLPPGRYVSRCVFPPDCFNEGRFPARFDADIPNDRVLQVTDYDLTIAIEDQEGHGVNAEKLPGIMRPRLEWQPPAGFVGA